METQQTAGEIDLFAEESPSLETISRLLTQAHSSEAHLAAFREKVEQNMSKTGHKGLLAIGIGLYILGRDQEAVEKLNKANDCKEKHLYLAYALRHLGKTAEAIEHLEKSSRHGADALAVALEKAATHRQARDFDSARKQLDGCANFKNVSAEFHFQLARLLENQGEYDKATDNYKTAIELAPDHQAALFHLAYRCDLSGDEDAAIDYYNQITSHSPVYVNALLNLAVLYEDKDEYDKAANCVDKVLEAHPNHLRARLFCKDIESSKTMVYDEEKEKRKTRTVQILETPISDFELSVRSRNCLKKMNINTLGDLLSTSEADLLSYKNFGETSLREIKAILDSRGLQLGIVNENRQFITDEETPPAPPEPEDKGLLGKSIDELQLSVRAKRAMQVLNIRTLAEVVHKTDAELLGCKNFGVTSLNEIKKALATFGLSLRTLE